MTGLTILKGYMLLDRKWDEFCRFLNTSVVLILYLA